MRRQLREWFVELRVICARLSCTLCRARTCRMSCVGGLFIAECKSTRLQCGSTRFNTLDFDGSGFRVRVYGSQYMQANSKLLEREQNCRTGLPDDKVRAFLLETGRQPYEQWWLNSWIQPTSTFETISRTYDAMRLD